MDYCDVIQLSSLSGNDGGMSLVRFSKKITLHCLSPSYKMAVKACDLLASEARKVVNVSSLFSTIQFKYCFKIRAISVAIITILTCVSFQDYNLMPASSYKMAVQLCTLVGNV